MAWRLAAAIGQLFKQANALAPTRSKASDGTIGDAAHAARSSDHNPHPVPGVGLEMVTAGDFTHDPPRFDSYRFAEALRLSRDKRIKYVISNGRIFYSRSANGVPAWTWQPYSGSDPHTNHAHVSVADTLLCDDASPWNLEGYTMADPQVTTTNWRLFDTLQLHDTTDNHVNNKAEPIPFVKAFKALLADVAELKTRPAVVPAPVDPAVLAAAVTAGVAAALQDPTTLQAIAKAVNDDDHRRSAD